MNAHTDQDETSTNRKCPFETTTDVTQNGRHMNTTMTAVIITETSNNTMVDPETPNIDFQETTRLTTKDTATNKRLTRRLKGTTAKQKRRLNKKCNKTKQLLTNNAVTNLSSVKLSVVQLSVLTKGLTFVPSHTRISYNTTSKEIQIFERKLQLHNFFHTNKTVANVNNRQSNKFESNRTFWPPVLEPKITQFCRDLKAAVITLHNTRMRPNLHPAEIKALQELHDNSNIVVKKGDKGAGIVVMNTCDYEQRVDEMLSDVNTYTQIPTDICTHIKQQSDVLITRLYEQRKLSKKQLLNLTSYEVQCPKFYGVPKVHKTGCPLRPIVSQMNGPTRKLHDALDCYLAVAEKQIPYLLQDTTAFINLLNNKQHLVNTNSILVTLDVVSLYTNIPQQEGAQLVADFYDETLPFWTPQDNYLKPISKTDLIQLILFSLQNTIFQFNNKYYRQNYGCSMGAQSSVKFANIFMHKFLKNFCNQYKGYLPEFMARLVDDIFTVWNSDLDTLTTFVEALNTAHPTIKFELKYSLTEIQFLDTIVYKEDGILKTKLYTKPTDKKQYLHHTSSHPAHTKLAIPFSQALRYRRLITDNSLLTTELSKLKAKFYSRQYPRSSTDTSVDKVLELDRASTLIYKTKYQRQADFAKFVQGDNFLPLILTYHPTLHPRSQHNIKQILTERWTTFMDENPSLKQTFGSNKPQLVYKKHKTLSEYLTSATHPPPWQHVKTSEDEENLRILTDLLSINSPSNVQRCNRTRCGCCHHLQDLTHLKIFNDITLPSTQILTCNSRNIVYLIHCNKCSMNYVGETKRQLKDRLNNHRSTIKTKKPTAIAIHFNEPQHNINNLQIMPIETLSTDSEYERKLREAFWMKKLHTVYPLGLNNYPIIYTTT